MTVRFWLIFFVVLLVILWFFKGVLLPFVIALILAYLLNPMTNRVQSLHIPRTAATLLVLSLALLSVMGIVVLIIPILQAQLSVLLIQLPYITDFVKTLSYPWIERILEQTQQEHLSLLREAVTNYFGSLISWLGNLLSHLISGGLFFFDLLGLMIITPIVTFYLLRDWHWLLQNLDSYLPKAYAPIIRQQCLEVDRTLTAFLYGQATLCLILAVFYSIALWLVGLDFALLVGLLSGILSFIPYVGSLTGMVLSCGLALIQFENYQISVLTFVIFLFGNFVEGYILYPRLIGKSLALHPVWIIFALVIGGHVLGFLGVLIAVPTAAILSVVVKFFLQQYLNSPYYAGHSREHNGKSQKTESPRDFHP